MEAFEMETLRRFDAVVAVSDRDANCFQRRFGADNVSVIPTGVDLDYYSYAPPGDQLKIVFTGAMDWIANIDAMQFFMDEIWPPLAVAIPDISMTVVGRNPPRSLTDNAVARGIRWEFTGFVDDIRPYVRAASVYVIPLRVGGGTRIKVYEAMAMGCPVVSTSIGVEGLPVEEDRHYCKADTPSGFINAILGLIRDRNARKMISAEARSLVEENFSSRVAARVFEGMCTRAAENSCRGGQLPVG